MSAGNDAQRAMFDDPEHTALINVHWQHDIVTADGAFAPFFAEQVARNDAIATTGHLVDSFRRAGALVIWARAAFAPGYPDLVTNCPLNRAIADLGALVEGSKGSQIIPELAPLEPEPVVSHGGTSAFANASLDLILRRAGIRTVAFTGVATNITVEGTARDAVNLGYRSFLVSDACAAATDEAHNATLATFELLGGVLTAEQAAP